MVDFRRFADDFDNIKTDMRRTQFPSLEKMHRRPGQFFPLGAINGGSRPAKVLIFPGLHLNKNQRIALPDDQINLVIPDPHITSDDFKPGLPEKFFRQRLAPPSGF